MQGCTNAEAKLHVYGIEVSRNRVFYLRALMVLTCSHVSGWTQSYCKLMEVCVITSNAHGVDALERSCCRT